jgi:hypothetical protein
VLAASALVCLVVENSSLLTTLHCIPLALIKPLCIRALQTFVEQPSVYVLVPERGNYPSMNGPALYMNRYLNMNGAVFVVPSMNCTDL